MSNWILPSLFVFAVIWKSFHDKSINSIQCDFLGGFRIDRHCNQCNVTVRWFNLNFNISLGLESISGWFKFGLGWFRVGAVFISSWGHFWFGSFQDGPQLLGSGRAWANSGRDQFGSGPIRVGVNFGRGHFGSGSVRVEKFRRKNSWLNKKWNEKCMEGIILERIFCWSVGRTEC